METHKFQTMMMKIGSDNKEMYCKHGKNCLSPALSNSLSFAILVLSTISSLIGKKVMLYK